MGGELNLRPTSRFPARLAALVVGLATAWLLSAAPILAQQQPQQQGPFLEIYLTNFVFDEASNSYNVTISITDLSQVKAIEPRLLDLATGENVLFGRSAIQVDQSPVAFSLPADQLKPTRKYRLALRAIDRRAASQYVRRQGQNVSDDPLTFASQEFTYSPAQAVPVTFEIDGVNADFPTHRLSIAIHHSTTDRPLRYEVVITNKAGAALGQLGPSDLDLRARTVSGPLPAQMEQIDQPADYHATMRLFASDDKLLSEQVKDFSLPAPPSPSITEKVANAFMTYPWLGWSLGLIGASLLLALVVWRVLPRRKRPLPRPHNLAPVVVAVARPRFEQVIAPVITSRATTPPPPQIGPAELAVYTPNGPGSRYVLNTDEATIGRSNENSIVLTDRFASRRQARIVRDGTHYILRPELDASQQTRVNGQPVVGPQILTNGDQIEMGRTRLVFAE